MIQQVTAVSPVTKLRQDDGCPLWYYRNIVGDCKCGDHLSGNIQCNDKDKTVSIKSCYCMTTDNNDQPSVSYCLYTCNTLKYNEVHSISFNSIGTNTTTNLNNVTCGSYNRKGTACGECIEGHGLPVYSYSLLCVECSDYKYNWLKYIAVAYIPLTLFYFIVIIFRISATSGLMIGYVTVSQMVSIVRLALIIENKCFIQVYATLYSIWNLDFFRSLYSPFCLHPQLTSLQVLSLDYLIAIYPMILVFLTYAFVKLHDSFRLTVCLCRPLYKCLHYFRKEWDIKSSLIGAFAIMLLLSYVKTLNVTILILTPNYSYFMNGRHGRFYAFNDMNTLYLSKEHLPYFVTAIAMSFVFNIIPLLLLCIDPCRCFRRCLNSTGLQHQVLHTFMDAFQGCYKHKPRDLRFFSAIYLLFQIINLFLHSVLPYEQYNPAATYTLICIITLLCIFRPFKNKWHNIFNITPFFAILLLNLAVKFKLEGNFAILTEENDIWIWFNVAIITIAGLVPPMQGVASFLEQVMPLRVKRVRKKVVKYFFQKNEETEELLPYNTH